MAQMIPVRVRRVVDGVLYDSERAEVAHYWDEGVLGMTLVRFVLGRTPCGRYFLTSLTDGSMLRPGPNIDVTPFSRIASIGLLADVGAPDSALEGLGVEMITPDVPDDSTHPPTVETVLSRRKRFGRQTLVKGHSGRFWMVRWWGIFGWGKSTVRLVSQRKAICWAVKNGLWATSDRPEMLGIRT